MQCRGWDRASRGWERVTLVDLPLEVAVPPFRVVLALSLLEWQLRCMYMVTVQCPFPSEINLIQDRDGSSSLVAKDAQHALS